MAQKRINDVNAGVRRPYRLSDLQDLWDGLGETLALGTDVTPRIISGFNVKKDSNLSSGVVAFKNKLYYHADTTGRRITVGANVYAREIASDDLRVFADGTTQLFSFERVAGVTATQGTLIGAFSVSNIATWRMGVLADNSVTSAKLADRAVTENKLADRSVSAVKLHRACAPCIPGVAFDYPLGTDLTYTIGVAELLHYNTTAGVWECNMVHISQVPREGSTLELVGGGFSTPAGHAELPTIVPVVVRGSNDDFKVRLDARGTSSGLLFNLIHSSPATEYVYPQGYVVLVMFVKTAEGFIPYSATAYNDR